MRTMTTVMMVLVLASSPARADQSAVTPADQAAALKAMAGAIPAGSRVKLQVREGRRMTATLMQVTNDAVVVQRVSRVPEAPVTIRFEELAVLHLEEKSGFSIGKAVGIGLAAGVGAILTLLRLPSRLAIDVC